jgi:hypothetical protein
MRNILVLMVTNLTLFGLWSVAQKRDVVVAIGEVISEEKQVLQLNKAPCATVADPMGFVKPWKKTVVGTKSCPTKSGKVKTYTEVQVEQLEESPSSNTTGKAPEQPPAKQPPTKSDAPPAGANPSEKPPEPPANKQETKPNDPIPNEP